MGHPISRISSHGWQYIYTHTHSKLGWSIHRPETPFVPEILSCSNILIPTMKFNADLFVLVAAFSVFLGSNQADGEVTFYHLDHNETNELNSTNVDPDSKAASILSITRDSGAIAFECTVIATGIVGTIANGVMLVTMFKSKQISTEDTKYLILNQLVLDLFSCVLVVITYSLKVLDITYEDGVGFRFVCYFLASEFLLFVSLLNSTNSLVAIAIERYLKIVRWSCSRHNYKPWMTRMMIITTWSLTAILTLAEIPTSRIIGGQCITLAFWSYKWSGKVYVFFVSLLSFVVPYSIMVQLYWRILRFVRLRVQETRPGPNHAWYRTSSFQKQVGTWEFRN